MSNNKSKTIKIKNELPEILEALCNHPDCPEWLSEGIDNLFSEAAPEVNYSADYWRWQTESLTQNVLDAEVIDAH